MKVARADLDLPDRLLVPQKRPPDPANRFHHHHPRPLSPPPTGRSIQWFGGGSVFDADHPQSRVWFASEIASPGQLIADRSSRREHPTDPDAPLYVQKAATRG